MSHTFDELQRQFRRSPTVFLRTLQLLSPEELQELILAYRQELPRLPEGYTLEQALPGAYHRTLRAEQWAQLNAMLDLDADLPGADLLAEAIRINAGLGQYAMVHYTQHLLALMMVRISLTSVS